jgi:hypothetical protein
MMIAAKNDAMTTATAAMTTDWKAQGLGNSVNVDSTTTYAADPTL